MAGVIRFNHDFYVQNGALVQGPTFVRAELTQTGQGGPNPGTVTVTTTAASISTGLSSLGMCRVTNLDTANFVEIGPYTGGTLYPFIKLKPNDPPFIFRLKPGITIGAKADTANCKVNFEIFED